MSLRVVLHVRLPLILGTVLMLAACGMKGSLYLEPDEDEEEEQVRLVLPDTRRA